MRTDIVSDWETLPLPNCKTEDMYIHPSGKTGGQNMLADLQLVSSLGFWRTHIPHLGTLLAPVDKTDPKNRWSPPTELGLMRSCECHPRVTAEVWVQKFSIRETWLDMDLD